MLLSNRAPAYRWTQAGQVRLWQRNPGRLDYALSAALHYARRFGHEMVIVPGNTYMRRAYHIARPSDSLVRYTVMHVEARVVVVAPDGQVSTAVATEEGDA